MPAVSIVLRPSMSTSCSTTPPVNPRIDRSTHSSVRAGVPAAGAAECCVWMNTFWMPCCRLLNMEYSFSMSSSRTRCVTMAKGSICCRRTSPRILSQYLCTGAWPLPMTRTPVCMTAPMLKWFVYRR